MYGIARPIKNRCLVRILESDLLHYSFEWLAKYFPVFVVVGLMALIVWQQWEINHLGFQLDNCACCDTIKAKK